MSRKNKRLELKDVLVSLLRNKRDCSIGMYLLLLELEEDGELSSLSLDRRLKSVGMANPRQLLSMAMTQRWIVPRDSEDGRYWKLSVTGQAMVAGLRRRVECARMVEEKGVTLE